MVLKVPFSFGFLSVYLFISCWWQQVFPKIKSITKLRNRLDTWAIILKCSEYSDHNWITLTVSRVLQLTGFSCTVSLSSATAQSSKNSSKGKIQVKKIFEISFFRFDLPFFDCFNLKSRCALKRMHDSKLGFEMMGIPISYTRKRKSLQDDDLKIISNFGKWQIFS